jgi:3-methyl-2-oxobutanoate hydroxymethyltransferase
VRQGVKKSLLIVDMPKGSYLNAKKALSNAKKIMKETKCNGVKIENNKKNYNVISKLTNAGIPVMGHIGYTPQFKKKFKVEGQNTKEEKKLIKEAQFIEKAGAFSIVLECISTKVSKKITEKIKIPTIGIGASIHCDGQILVTDDIIGLSGFKPKFVKIYANLYGTIKTAIKRYSNDVKKKRFPKKVNSF